MNSHSRTCLFHLALLLLMVNSHYALAKCEPLVTKDYNLVQDFTSIVYNRYSAHPTVMVQAIKNKYFTTSIKCMEENELNGLIDALTIAFASLPEKDSYVEEYINKLKKIKNKEKPPKTDGKKGNSNSVITSQEIKELIAKFDTIEKKIVDANQKIDSAEQKVDILLGLVILLSGVIISLLLRQGTKNPAGQSPRKKSRRSDENNDEHTLVAEPDPTDETPKQSNTFKTASVAKAETPDEIAPKANRERISEKQPEALVTQPNKKPESIASGNTYFYLSTPTSKEGRTTFVDQRSRELDPTSSFYKFSLVQEDEHKALFWYVDDPDTVRSALDYPNRYLKPACKYDSNLNYDAKQIITDQPGIAVLNGSVWQVQQKALIHTV